MLFQPHRDIRIKTQPAYGLTDFCLATMPELERAREEHVPQLPPQGLLLIDATLITSHLPIGHWHDHIRDPTIADAIMDRLIHNAHRIQLKGGSMRKKQKLDGN